MSQPEQNVPMFSGPLCYVEKMTATSTTSPKGEPSPDLESDREIQNALDKKRKKRKSVQLSDVSVKHAKLDCSINSKINQYIEATKELETTQRISQDLPNCNWLEEKIKLSETRKWNKIESSIHKNLAGSDSEEEHLVVDDLVVDDGSEKGDSLSTAHPPCISIAETEGSQPVEIKFHIKSVDEDSFPLEHFMKKRESPMIGTEAANQEVKSDLRNFRSQNYSERRRSFAQETKLDIAETLNHENLKDCDNKIRELISAKHDLEKDIDALKNQKIQEMIQLLDIKTSKEKYMTELEGLRSEIAKERAVLATLKTCSAPPAPALDLSSSDSGEEAGHSLIPSLAPAQRGQARPRDMRQHPARPDYYRHMFDPSAAKVPRLCEGKGREYNNLLAGGLPQANHQPLHHPQLQHHPPHHPPMMHYMGHHNQPVNLSRAMDPEIAEKTRMSPAVNLHQMQAIYKVSQSHGGQEARPGPVTSASAFGLPGPPHLPHHSYLAAARQRLLPPTSLDTESKCEVCGSPANFMCSACKLVHYCSAACQKGHWSLHGRSCRKL